MPQAHAFTLPLIKKVKIAPRTYSFFFSTEKLPSFTFSPGQYLRMHIPNEKPDQRGTSRFFTISSSPLDKTLMITTHVIKSSFKKKLLAVQPGDEISFFGPMGTLTLPNRPIPLVFLAEGIGVTPFYSMIRFMNQKKISMPVTLIVTFETFEDCLFYPELMRINKKQPNISVIYSLLQKTKNNQKWPGAYGAISKKLLQAHISTLLSSNTFFIVGSSQFVENTRILIEKLGVEDEKIRNEDFIGYA